MCTEKLFGILDWYSIWIIIGVGLCLFVFDKLCNVRGITVKANKFYYMLGIASILLGFGGALLVQSLYNYIDAVKEAAITGIEAKWEWGGLTFMGGMYSGVLVFVVGSLLFAKGEVRAQFGKICQIGLACIPTAHAFGRLGCFASGCCYGAEVKPDDPFAFLGFTFKTGHAIGELRYPTQIIESVFLMILAAVLIVLVIKDKRINQIVYFAAYGTFRFCLEFLRDDARGSIGANSLSPSQVLSIVSVVIAIIMLVLLLVSKTYPEAGKKILHFFKLDVEMPQTVVEVPVEAAETPENNEGTDENK